MDEKLLKTPFSVSEKKLVQKLYAILYGSESQNRFRLDGIPQKDFLRTVKEPALKRALLTKIKDKKEVENFKKIDFYLEACIEQGFIRRETSNKLKLTARGYQLISYNWRDWIRENLSLLVAGLLFVATAIIALYTGQQAIVLQKQIQNSQNQQSATFMIDFNSQLRNGIDSYSGLISAIANDQPILYGPKAKFTDEKVDDYLMMWGLLDDVVDKNLITDEMASDAFSYDVEKAYCNPDIKKYVQESQAEEGGPNSGIDGGFTNIAREFIREDDQPFCSENYIVSQDYQ